MLFFYLILFLMKAADIRSARSRIVVFSFVDEYFCSVFFFFSSRRRHTRYIGDWSSDVCSSDLAPVLLAQRERLWHAEQGGHLLEDPELRTARDTPGGLEFLHGITHALIESHQRGAGDR